MKLLDLLVDAFINTFGITRPSEAGRRRASFFILALMVLLLIGVCAAGLLLRRGLE